VASASDGRVRAGENYESWNIAKDGLRLNFDACKIDACAEGKEEVLISFAALKEKVESKVQ
jgi:hypothetical protein